MKTSVVSIDLAKNVFQVCALNQARKLIFNKKVKRADLLDVLRQFEPTYIAMEACYSANYWAREIVKLGHEPALIPAIKVKPFVIGNKNDANDALAIAEAFFRPNMVFVKHKTIEQQDIQCFQRIRERHVKQRTQISNQIRGFLADYGIIVNKKLTQLRIKLPRIIEDADQPLTVVARQFIQELYAEIKLKDDQIKQVELQQQALLKTNAHYQRIQGVKGIGPVIAAEIIPAVSDGKQFKNGRSFAAWIGLTPRQHSSGDNDRMGSITKRGNRELRKLLIHGARSIMNWCSKYTDSLNLWVQSLLATKPAGKVIVAVANKLARMVWVVLATGAEYQPSKCKMA